MSQTLFVGGIAYGTTQQSLSDLFSGAGNVVSANIITDRQTGRSKGFGFVEMSSAEEAQKAIEMFNGKDLDGRQLAVNLARPKEDRPRRESRY
ncbi:MAG: RNA-binding protein [Patescibacteria group bacterium]